MDDTHDRCGARFASALGAEPKAELLPLSSNITWREVKTATLGGRQHAEMLQWILPWQASAVHLCIVQRLAQDMSKIITGLTHMSGSSSCLRLTLPDNPGSPPISESLKYLTGPTPVDMTSFSRLPPKTSIMSASAFELPSNLI